MTDDTAAIKNVDACEPTGAYQAPVSDAPSTALKAFLRGAKTEPYSLEHQTQASMMNIILMRKSHRDSKVITPRDMATFQELMKTVSEIE